MRHRRNVTSLTPDQRAAYVNAVLELKKKGRYDQYVHWHHHVMVPTVLPDEPKDAGYRNGAHLGPAFLPWHREFLLQLEDDLQAIDPSVTIPYWDWAADAARKDARTASIWQDDFMGGDGKEFDQWRVQTGPFAYKNGNWPVPSYPDDDLPGRGSSVSSPRSCPTSQPKTTWRSLWRRSITTRRTTTGAHSPSGSATASKAG